MIAERDHKDYLLDIQGAIQDILDFTHGLDYEAFTKDKKTSYAVVRALEIVGEASKKIPPETRDSYPEVPWKEMAGIRDKLIHEYFGVNSKVVWNAVMEDIPRLKPLIADVIEKEV
jgi:uncharacterized protein with HEPN domain